MSVKRNVITQVGNNATTVWTWTEYGGGQCTAVGAVSGNAMTLATTGQVESIGFVAADLNFSDDGMTFSGTGQSQSGEQGTFAGIKR